MDKFEKHLRDRKDNFDLQEVNPAIWEGILKAENTASLKPLRRPHFRWSVAAAIILLAIGWTLLRPTEPNAHLSADLLEEYGFDQSTPGMIIATKLAKLEAIPVPKGYEEATAFVLQEIEDLDKRNSVLLEELDHAPAGVFVQQQALSYYRKKVDLLNQLIEDLQKIQRNEKAFPSPAATTSSI